MRYRIRPTPQAEADIERLFRSIAERRDEDAAREWYESYVDGVARLTTMPFSCGFAYENADFPEELRHLLFGDNLKRRYRALFVIHGDEVVILAIRAPGERPIDPRRRHPRGVTAGRGKRRTFMIQ